VVVFGVVSDHDHSAAGSNAGPAEALHERKKGHPVELVCFTTELKLPVPYPYRPKVSNTAPRRSVKQNRILDFRRDPHLTPGTMLLEVHFVCGPEVHRLVGH
jgi:hypothetical protein